MAWNIDKSHSEVSFTVRHMMFAKVRGTFHKWSGALTDDGGKLTGVEVNVEVASVDTREEARDNHLRSGDFFLAEQFPHMTFKATPQGDQSGNFKLVGDLTIRGITRPVTLDVEFLGEGKDPWGNPRRGYKGSTTINRTEFGLNWNAALEAGGILVGEQVTIEVDVQVVGS